MSAVAALAVASPFAYEAVSGMLTDTKPPVEHHDFVKAAGMTDLPGELMSALSQGLSQFGVNLPPVPSLTGATSPGGFTSPGLAAPGLTPGLTSPDLTSPGLTSPGLTTPGLTPGLTSPGLTSPGLTPGATPGLTPGLTPGATPGLTPGATPGLTPTTPGLTPGTTPGPTSPGGLTPGLTNPAGFDPALTSPGLGAGANEYPISDPIGLDPGAGGTYPILGDPSLGAAPSGGSGGLVSDMMSAANQLGAGQAIDLLKGVLMPGITQAMHGATPGAAVPGLPAPPVPTP
jgi:GLTT repeat (6 copies)